MLPNKYSFFLKTLCLLLVGSLLASCFWTHKKNLENLKRCKFIIKQIFLKTEQGGGLIPKITLIPIVSIENPNEEDVEIYKFQLKSSLLTKKEGEISLGNIINEENRIVPKFSNLEIPLIIRSENNNGFEADLMSVVFALMSASLRGEKAEVKIQGTISIHSPIGSIEYPISETQTIDLLKK
ncbi:hypothetical protein LPTSP4_26920 [Leptospira ryugenii]|uniref:Late embryogenesis abundant protein n=1 Tax=Leptospira ryugenii TaxID=1917863 RepID=A0A2P2E2R4_9LEPT|nr:hypothetical protein [Leptospira ryugenii]GBF51160.1 hypothetical protein LPTSP4_26920 [Leptospira ryugenii]